MSKRTIAYSLLAFLLLLPIVEHGRFDLYLLIGWRSGYVSAGYWLRSVWRHDGEPVFLARGDERLSVNAARLGSYLDFPTRYDIHSKGDDILIRLIA